MNGWVLVELGKEGQVVEWHRTKPEALVGIWETNEGRVRSVVEQFCTWIDGRQSPVTLLHGQLMVNGWSAVKVTPDAVKWQLRDKVMEWKRCRPEVLNGAWRCADGVWCSVIDGMCRFSDGSLSFPIKLSEGWLRLNTWTVTTLTWTVVTWQDNERTLEWRRPQLEDLSGVWWNTATVRVHVSDGVCSFSPESAPSPILLQEGRLCLNGWRVDQILQDQSVVVWQKGSETLRWFREGSTAESSSGHTQAKRKALSSGSECTLCLHATPEVALDPCGHVATCLACSAELSSCPVCRKQINKRLRVFFP